MENVSLKVHNYKTSEKQNREIKYRLELLIKQIPYNSKVLLSFDYKDKFFYGKLTVNFDGKSFVSTDKNKILVPLTNSLSKKLQKQVMKWKKSRTAEEITGVIALGSPNKEGGWTKKESYLKAG